MNILSSSQNLSYALKTAMKDFTNLHNVNGPLGIQKKNHLPWVEKIKAVRTQFPSFQAKQVDISALISHSLKHTDWT